MIIPDLGLPAYTCPHCRAFAQQRWFTVGIRMREFSSGRLFEDETFYASEHDKMSSKEKGQISFSGVGPHTGVTHLKLSRCSACDLSAIWFYGQMIFPSSTDAPIPNPDLPEVCLKDYEEAAKVLSISARAASALLRLSLEKLCRYLLKKDKGNINSMIGEFTKNGIPTQITQAMDVLRVIGNEAVHAGTMDDVDNKDTALGLFRLINIIADVMITQPKHVSNMYDLLPQDKKEAIEGRNSKISTTADPAA